MYTLSRMSLHMGSSLSYGPFFWDPYKKGPPQVTLISKTTHRCIYLQAELATKLPSKARFHLPSDAWGAGAAKTLYY